ncbi:Trpt1 [Symbiodinium sp. CCMP2592]|nr:Trpt1 [Symbiodinium sp. CCMP2592]
MGRRAGPRSRWRPDGRRRRTQGEIAKRKAKAAERAAQAAAQDQDQDPTDTEEDEDGPEREPVPADRDEEEADDQPPEHEPAGDSVEVRVEAGPRKGSRNAASQYPKGLPSLQIAGTITSTEKKPELAGRDLKSNVADLATHGAGATLTDIQEAVHANDKQRFQLSWQGRGHGRELLIRATQGHSQQQVQDDLLLTRITAPHEVPLAVHGTHFRHYSSIYHQGLRAGGDRGQRARKHVHFAMALRRDQHRATSGMRKDVEILLYLDIPRALRDNMRLCVSTNSVVLTEGFNGCIPIDYIMKVQYMHRQCANDVPGDSIPSPGRLKPAFAAIGVSPQEGSRGRSPAPERVPKSRSFLTRLAVIKLPPRLHDPSGLCLHPFFLRDRYHPIHGIGRLGLYLGAAAAPDKALATGFPLHLSLASSCLIASSQLTWFADFLQHFSIMYRPAGGPRQHYRPDGTRRRTAGELAKRAARAAAKAQGTDGAQPSQSDSPAMPKGQQLTVGPGMAPPPKQVQVDGPATGAGDAFTNSGTGSTTATPAANSAVTGSRPKEPPPPVPLSKKASGKGLGRGPPPAPKQLEWVPKRTKAPPPGIDTTLGGAQAAPAEPVRPATATEVRPASPAKRSAPMPANAPTTTTTDQDITQAAPDGEPTLTTTSLTLRMDAGQPQKKRRSKTVPPPNTAPALDALRLKWDLLLRVHEAAAELQDADVPHLLHLYQAAGGYTARHHDFHLMRDKLMQEGVVGPSGVPLPLPPVGNYILSLGVSILGLQSSGYLPQISRSSTCGDLVEAWSLALWESSRRDLLEQLGELFTLLHSLVSNIPRRVYIPSHGESRSTS